MRQLPVNLLNENISLERAPRLAIKFYNDQGDFWVTSHSDVTPGDGLDVFKTLVATSANSQQITPEKGFSTIGGMTITIQDVGFTDRLRAIQAANDTINNNKAEVYMGFEGLAFGDYGKLFTFIVDGIESSQLEYVIKLSDRQRLQKRSIFTPKTTKLFAVVEGSDLNDLTTSTVLDGSGVIEVLDASVLSLVEHDADWDTDPSTTIGYFQIKGVDDAGNDKTEIFSFTGFDVGNPNRLTGVTRSLFGTSAIEAKGSVNDGSTEVDEFVYIDLPIPKMILALLTGDLYGQPGQTIPSHWQAGLNAADIDLASFENIGDDLWQLPFSFEGAEKDEAKGFIAREILRATNLFLKINQDGELELKRFTSVPQNSAPSHVFNEGEIISISKLSRDAKNIRNRFLINWEWRSDIERFVRNNLFVDQDSIDRNNVTSDVLTLNFKGVRNRSRDIQNSLQSLAEGIRARYSDPAIIPSITVPMAYGLEVEVGDIVGVNLAQWPDYANTDNLNSTFEVQSTSIDLINQTVTLNLFGTSGIPSPIDFGLGADVVTIDHTGWKELSASLTSAGISYTESGGTLTITGDGILAGGDTTAPENRYYYDGNVTVADGVVLTVTKNFVLDAVDVDLSGATIDGRGQGLPGGNGALLDDISGVPLISNYTTGQAGYLGGEDLAEEGVLVLIVGKDKLYRYPKNNGSVPPARSHIESLTLRVDNSNGIVGLRSSGYMGSSGSGGMYSVSRDASGLDNQASNGGDGGNGGASVTLFCENLFTNSSTLIDTSGGDATAPTQIAPFNDEDRAGAGGPGWPGCLLTFIKLSTSPIPILTNRHKAEVGIVTGLETYEYYPKKSNAPVSIPGFGAYDSAGPLPSAAAATYKGADISSSARLAKYLTSDSAAPQTPGVDKLGPAQLPTALTLTEQINTPQTPKGNVSTITVTATPPTDDRYSYSIFEYRLLGQQAWYPLEYKLGDETTKELPTDGSTYQFSARSVSTSGQVSTGRIIQTITLSVVSEDPGQTDTDDDSIQVAQIRRLELTNAVSDDNDTQWKGPDAQFRWAKLRFGETTVDSDPKQDQHLDGYRVQIFRTSDSVLLREATVQDTFFNYTLADNRRDNIAIDGTPEPVRAVTIKVSAVSSTGKTSHPASLSVDNPEPEAPGTVVLSPGFTSMAVTFGLPGDVDFVGVNLYLLQASTGDPFDLVEPILISGNSHTFDDLIVGQDYRIGLESVDRFGPGGRSAIFAVATRKIESTELGDISSPVTIDENGGRFITNNSGFISILGALSRPTISPNPLILHAWDGNTSPFWVDAAGNASFAGALDAATGTFSGDLSAAGGTFSGSLSAATGSFEGAVYIGSTTFGDAGIQQEENAGNPRSYIGDGQDSFLKYENGVISVGEDSALLGSSGYTNQGFILQEIKGVEFNSLMNDVSNITLSLATGTEYGATKFQCTSTSGLAYYKIISGVGFGSPSFSNDFKFKVNAAFDFTSGTSCDFGVNTIDDNQSVSFELTSSGDLILSVSFDGASSSTNFGSVVTVSQFNEYEIRFVTSSGDVSLYANGSLVGTLTGAFGVGEVIEALPRVLLVGSGSIAYIGDMKLVGEL